MENDSKREKELETADRERSERKVRKENTKKKTTVTMASLTPDDRDAKTRTTTTLALITIQWYRQQQQHDHSRQHITTATSPSHSCLLLKVICHGFSRRSTKSYVGDSSAKDGIQKDDTVVRCVQHRSLGFRPRVGPHARGSLSGVDHHRFVPRTTSTFWLPSNHQRRNWYRKQPLHSRFVENLDDGFG